ncbi:MAG: hypothetical protein ACI9OJ_003260 [Myxococcota bacterium]|jgi:hypothetical protein
MIIPEHLAELGFDGPPDLTAGAGESVGILDGGVAAIAAFRGRLERLTSTGEIDGGQPTEHATRCASLIGSADAAAPGVAPGVKLVSLNVSRNQSADPDCVAAALDLLGDRGVRVASCSFVFETTDDRLADAVERYLDRGYILVGAAGNSKHRQGFHFSGRIPRVVRVFANAIAPDSLGTAVEVCAPGRRLAVVGCDGIPDLGWPGKSSGATALVAGLAALGLARGLSAVEVRAEFLRSATNMATVDRIA